jgi:hypothetical protein
MAGKRSKKAKKSTKKRTVRVRSYKRRPRKMRGGEYKGLHGMRAADQYAKDHGNIGVGTPKWYDIPSSKRKEITS